MNKHVVLGLLSIFLAVVQPLSSQQLPKGVPEYASFSVLIRDLKTGKDLVSLNAQKAMMSASLMKLVTTATSLEKFGPDYRFSTRFWTTGSIQNGILHGDLIIEGMGDPTLGSKYFDARRPASVLQKIEAFLRREGIDEISGKILIDEGCFDPFRYPSKRLWEDMGNYYGAPPSGLSWRDNSFEIALQSSDDIGAICKVVSVSPWVKNLAFRSFVTSASQNKDSAYIYGVPGQPEWQIRGSIPAGRNYFAIKGALPEPGLSLGFEVSELFHQEKNVPVEITAHGDWRHSARLIGEIESPPLSEIVEETNQKSINLFADHLLLILGLASDDSIASVWDKGLWEIESFWNKRLDNGYLSIEDGSGLSPLNKISANFLVEMLEYIYKEGRYFEEFKNSLSQNGHSGTLKYMWGQPALKGKIYGKSGSMQDVLGYAGYYFPDEGEAYAFSVILNHHGMETKDARKIVENYVSDLLLIQ
jgi:D-alanyl-D-alanine carboxypeptidase/D-alanyl-D-alanine-endopeptidase (penicillin-binding protein 4)